MNLSPIVRQRRGTGRDTVPSVPTEIEEPNRLSAAARSTESDAEGELPLDSLGGPEVQSSVKFWTRRTQPLSILSESRLRRHSELTSTCPALALVFVVAVPSSGPRLNRVVSPFRSYAKTLA